MSAKGPALAVTAGMVALGGAAGALLRYGTAVLLPWSGDSWPTATFAVNVVGCLLMGLFLGRLSVLETVPPRVTPLVTTGFLGGLTTFSTFAAELDTLGGEGLQFLAVAYAVVSILFGILGVRAGWWFAQRGAKR